MQKEHEVCLRCGRKLKTATSKELGFGKVCWEKFNQSTTKKLFPIELSNTHTHIEGGEKGAEE